MTKIILAPTWELAKSIDAQLTVEAEYGAMVKQGTVYTAAHHQPSGDFAGRHVVEGGRPAPCNDAGIPEIEEGNIVVSHLDLDTLGGVLRAQGRKGLFISYASFWALAEFVDVNGAHKLRQANANEVDLARLYAWWAYSKTLPRYARDQVTDITADINEMCHALSSILTGDEAILAAGAAFRAEERANNDRTFVSIDAAGVIFRTTDRANDFVNHMYTTPEGHPAKAIVSHNLANGSITVSLADAVPGVSCREIVQHLWGPEAGGHAGIAGSPRGQGMTAAQAQDCVHETGNRLTNAVEAACQ